MRPLHLSKHCVQSAYEPIAPHQARAYPSFYGMKCLGVFLASPGWDASPSQGYPQHQVCRYPFKYTRVERGTVRVKCLAQEHNTMSPARAWTRITRSGVEHTNHEATTALFEEALFDDSINCPNELSDKYTFLDTHNEAVYTMNSHTITFFLQHINLLLKTVCENFQYSNLSEHIFILRIITQNANEKAQCSLVKIRHPNRKKENISFGTVRTCIKGWYNNVT